VETNVAIVLPKKPGHLTQYRNPKNEIKTRLGLSETLES
jgi:hypothetical protein